MVDRRKTGLSGRMPDQFSVRINRALHDRMSERPGLRRPLLRLWTTQCAAIPKFSTSSIWRERGITGADNGRHPQTKGRKIQLIHTTDEAGNSDNLIPKFTIHADALLPIGTRPQAFRHLIPGP